METAGEFKDWETRCLDVLSLTPPVFGKGYKNSYLFLIDRLPRLWGIFYDLLDQKILYFILRPLRRLVNHWAARRLEELLMRENPTVVISTHFLPTEVAARLKKKGQITSRIITVVTDSWPHWFWIAEEVDHFAVALPDTKEALIRRGVPASKISVLGIPIEKKFSDRRSKSVLCQKLGLDERLFTTLVTSGGAAVGSIEEITVSLLKLKERVQVLVVCGTNRLLHERLTVLAEAGLRLKIFGFVDNMNELMEASDVVIGKGGGLTLSESLAEERPMIIFRPVPGQEARNARCIKKYRAGVVAHSLEEVVSKVSEFLASPRSLEILKENGRRLAKPAASRDILTLAGYGK